MGLILTMSPPIETSRKETAETPYVDGRDSTDHEEQPDSREAQNEQARERMSDLGPDSPQIVKDMTAYGNNAVQKQVLPEVLITEGDSSNRDARGNQPASGSAGGNNERQEGSNTKSGSKPTPASPSADSSAVGTNGTEDLATAATQSAPTETNPGAKPAHTKRPTESGTTGETVSAEEQSLQGEKTKQAIKPSGESDSGTSASQPEVKASDSTKHDPSERSESLLPHAAKRAPEAEGEKHINQQAQNHEQPSGTQADAVLPPAVPKVEKENKPRNEDSESSTAPPLSQLINQPQHKDAPKDVIPDASPAKGEATETIPGIKKLLNSEKGGMQDLVASDQKIVPSNSDIHADSKQPNVVKALPDKAIEPSVPRINSQGSGSPEPQPNRKDSDIGGQQTKERVPSPGDTIGSGILHGLANTTKPLAEAVPAESKSHPGGDPAADPKGKEIGILPAPEKGKGPEDRTLLSTLLDNSQNPQNPKDSGKVADVVSALNKDQSSRLDNRISDTVKSPEPRNTEKLTAEPKDLGAKAIETRLSETRPQEFKTEVNTQEFKKDIRPLESKAEPVSENKKKDEDKSLEHERLLQQLFANSVPAAPKIEKDDTPQVVSKAITPSNEKYEMAAADKEHKNPIAQLINKIESVVENKLSNIVASVGDKANNSSEIRTVSAAQTSLSKTELPLFQNPIMRINEIASELKRASLGDAARNINVDAGNKSSKLNSGEAISLKDLIAASRQLDPTSIKGTPIDVKGILPLDGKTAIDSGKIVDLGTGKTKGDASKVDESTLIGNKAGKIDPSTGIKTGANEELDNKDDKKGGLKGSDAQPDGRKVQDLTDKNDADSLDDEQEDDSDDEDKKDILEQNSDHDDEILNLILAGKKKTDVDLDENQDSEDKSSNENESRKKYVVKEGDTLQSIAKSILGDSRFDQLIEMVNRGQLKYQSRNGQRELVLKVGQIIWLPTSKEMKVFAGLYFGKGSNNKVLVAKRGDKNNVWQEADELIQTISRTIEEVVSKNQSTESSKETAIDFTPLERRKKKSRPTFSPNEQYSTGEWKEIEQFLNKLKDIAEHNNKNDSKIYFQSKDVELPLVAEDNLDIKILSTDTRIVIEYTCDRDDEEVFHARLERQYNAEWQTIAYYQSSASKAFRYLHKQNGGRKTFQLHIPNSIVREMAVKDLSRNWRSYVAEFESADLRNVVHTVPVIK